MQYLCGKIIAELEVFQERRHEDSGKEENDTPEENIWNVGSMGAAGFAHKLPSVLNAALQHQIEGRVKLSQLISPIWD